MDESWSLSVVQRGGIRRVHFHLLEFDLNVWGPFHANIIISIYKSRVLSSMKHSYYYLSELLTFIIESQILHAL